ncbi:MAG: DNA polymerase III subunit epsilon [gamma proteobacterium symbiont of Bathyaustriella thionipta]|nr:DNA polymerase III subunit epsilon [gamma proteobacterium symbiont of Bathyaustriella thionipta]
MRQVILDTETTGLEPEEGHRIIEIGCVEMIDRRLSGNNYHQYLQPDREIDEGALQVHGISQEFLADKPRFADVLTDLKAYLEGAELIIHNAPFDVKFLNAELALCNSGFAIADICSVIDTLVMARKIHPGQRNSLDALCKRYDINNTHRQLHGALLDSEILADVYLAMTGGQTALLLEPDDADNIHGQSAAMRITRVHEHPPLKVVAANAEELAAHEQKLQAIHKNAGHCIWLQPEPADASLKPVQ